MPPSTNRLWSYGKGRVFKSKAYNHWISDADLVASALGYSKLEKISGHFRIDLLIDKKARGDGDNRIKAILDWLQSRDFVRNDADCQAGSWALVDEDWAPFGARIILTPLSEK